MLLASFPSGGENRKRLLPAVPRSLGVDVRSVLGWQDVLFVPRSRTRRPLLLNAVMRPHFLLLVKLDFCSCSLILNELHLILNEPHLIFNEMHRIFNELQHFYHVSVTFLSSLFLPSIFSLFDLCPPTPSAPPPRLPPQMRGPLRLGAAGVSLNRQPFVSKLFFFLLRQNSLKVRNSRSRCAENVAAQ